MLNSFYGKSLTLRKKKIGCGSMAVLDLHIWFQTDIVIWYVPGLRCVFLRLLLWFGEKGVFLKVKFGYWSEFFLTQKHSV